MISVEERRSSVLERLTELSIPVRLYEHKAVFTMEEMNGDCGAALSEVGIPVKNLFLKEHKSDRYFLVVMDGKKNADIKSIRRYLGVKPLSFASEEQLETILGVPGGAVTPLAVLFDTSHAATIVIDDDLKQGDCLLGVHPADNAATVFLTYKELEAYTESCGHPLINMQV